MLTVFRAIGMIATITAIIMMFLTPDAQEIIKKGHKELAKAIIAAAAFLILAFIVLY